MCSYAYSLKRLNPGFKRSFTIANIYLCGFDGGRKHGTAIKNVEILQILEISLIARALLSILQHENKMFLVI